MKMRELEQRSGVGRETIRYYIRMGLLPEPTKPKPNVADYSDEHVRRLGVIKRLQAERYLPLGFIKQVLDRPTAGEIAALPGLDGLLAASLGVAPANGGSRPADAAAQAGLESAELEVLARDGVVEVRAGALARSISAIAKAWGRVKASGYSPEAGFFAEDARIYVETHRTAGPARDRALLRPAHRLGHDRRRRAPRPGRHRAHQRPDRVAPHPHPAGTWWPR